MTDFNIATIIRDGERATALAGTKPYMGKNESPFLMSVFYISRALTACLLTVPVCDSTELI